MRSPRLAEYYHAVAVNRLRRLAFDYVYYDIFGNLVVFHRVGLDFLDLAFKLRRLRILAYHLYDIAAGRHPQLREKVADKVYVGIVDAVERLRIHAVYYHYPFYQFFTLYA